MAKLTRTQFRKSLGAILESLEREPCRGSLGRAERKEKACLDFWFFFSHYLSHYAPEKSPKFHREIVGLLESGAPFVALGAPRGFAKSTLVSFVYVLWKIITGERRFIVLVSASDKLAVDLAGAIRRELQENARLREDFGDLLGERGGEGDFYGGKTRILALGRRRALRGFRSRQHRPDLIILDDIEKDEEALSPRVVGKTLSLITGGLIPALNPKAMRLVLVGTVQHSRSAAGFILKGEEEPFCHWERRIFRALEQNEEGQEYSLWEERFPLETLKSIQRQIGDRAFQTEFQNNPLDRMGGIFKAQWFTEAPDEENLPVALYIDPSPDGIKKNDYKAAVFLAKAEQYCIIVDAVFTQGSDSVFFQELISVYQRYRSRIVWAAGESNGFQGYFLKELKEAFRAQGIILPLRYRQNKMSKELRIARLAGWMETGRLVFEEGASQKAWARILKEQLVYFPSPSVHDDGPDALAGALSAWEEQGGSVTILPKKSRLFGP